MALFSIFIYYHIFNEQKINLIFLLIIFLKYQKNFFNKNLEFYFRWFFFYLNPKFLPKKEKTQICFRFIFNSDYTFL